MGEHQEKKEKKNDDEDDYMSIEMEQTAAATSTIPATQRNSFGQAFCEQRPKEALLRTDEGNVIV